MSFVRTTKAASPDQPDVEIQTQDPVPLLPGLGQVLPSNIIVPRAADSAVGAIDSVGMGGRTPASEIPQPRTVSFDEQVAAARADRPAAKGGASKIALAKTLGALANDGFTDEAQAKFAEKLAKSSTGDAAYMARALRSSVPQTQLSELTTLSDAFAKHGLKLDPLAKTDAKRDYANLDRGQFREALHNIIAGSDGVLTKGDVLTILDMVNHVSDLEDLEFARKELDKRVIAGELKLAPGVDKLVHGFFDSRLDVKVGNTELAFAARAVRLAVAAVDNAPNASLRAQAQNKLQAAKAVFKRMVARAMDDHSSPDAAFYARRVIDRELGKSPCAVAQKLRTELVGDISARLGDRLDRKALFAKIDAQVRSGALKPNEAAVLKIAGATSFSNGDLSYTVRQFELAHIHVAAFLAQIEEEIAEDIAREQRQADIERREEKRAEIRVEEEQRLLRHQQQLIDTTERDIERAAVHHVNDEHAVVATAALATAATIESQMPAASSDPDDRSALAGLAQYQRGIAEAEAPRAVGLH